MARKRMFSTTVVEDDVFLDMPASSQNLYFHLCMNADDDGFVGPRKVIRMCNASADDLNVLIMIRYVLLFESGVAVIKHWLSNNTIKKDRYSATTYIKEMEQLTLNEWNVYTEKRASQIALLDVNSITTVNSGEDDHIIQNGTKSIPQVRLGKVRLGKNRITTVDSAEADRPKKLAKIKTEIITELLQYWEDVMGYKIGNIPANRKAIAALVRQHGVEVVKKLVDGSKLALDDRYAPHISDFVKLKYKQNDLMIWGRKKQTDKKVVNL